jgi:outer membrane receptor protein involved in Fe transport
MNVMRTLSGVCAMAVAFATVAQSQTTQTQHEVIEVTATKIAEDVLVVPASVSVVDGDDIRARNANDLQSALALVGGVSIAPGGDAGPAGSVPEMWGLREFDAFLLVVDGVPWGGAFNPDLATLDMQNIDRIEVLRGAAPVMYGATSFVGVIHVIHRAAGAPGNVRASIGNYSSGSAAVSLPLSQSADLRQSLNFSYDKQGFRDRGTNFDRSHAQYRLSSGLAGGTLRFDADVTFLHQDPASPHVRTGPVLSPDTPLDANYNPRNSKLDQNRYYGVLGFDTHAAGMPWTTTLALTRADHNIVRGFLVDVSESDPNSTGFTQDRSVTDLYFDTHVVKTLSPVLRVVAGFDHLYGRGRVDSGLFDYFVPLDGSNRPDNPPPDEHPHLTDRRNFSGLYASAEWTAAPRLRIDAGVRLNHTSETMHGEDEDGESTDSRTFTRLSGSVGANLSLWSRDRDTIAVYADYRNTFKPAAIDFGPEAEGEILDPETAHSMEVGVKGRALGARFDWDASVFQMDFSNLVVATIRNGQPSIENAGSERFRGGELEAGYTVRDDTRVQLGYGYHDSRFRDFAKDFDGTVTQLAGRRLEMVPFDLISAGVVFSPKSGVNANVVANYSGERFLNQRNTAIAKAYTTVSGGIGFRMSRGELRFDARNINNVRPAVSESELGDSEYYRMPARTWGITYRTSF